MDVNDYVVTGIAANGCVRVIGAETTALVNEALRIHGTSPVATAALGRLLTGAVLLSKQLKNPTDTLTIQIKGRGPLGGVTAVADAAAQVRGYAEHPSADLPLRKNESSGDGKIADGKLDVSGAIGKGYMNVIKDMGMKEPYIGTVALVSGEIAEDLTYYLAVSEQIPSVVALGVQLAPAPEAPCGYCVSKAGGFMLQLLPGAEEKLISDLEQRVGYITSVTGLLSAGATIVNIAEDLLRGYDFQEQTRSGCAYRCNCSREKIARALISIGPEERKEMIEQDGGAEVHCQFCNQKYLFNAEELAGLS